MDGEKKWEKQNDTKRLNDSETSNASKRIWKRWTCRRRLDQAQDTLRQLAQDYHTLAGEYERSINQGALTMREIYHRLEQLQRQIQLAQQTVAQRQTEWETSLAETREKRVDAEAASHLHAANQKQVAQKKFRIHALESQETIMRQWTQRSTHQ